MTSPATDFLKQVEVLMEQSIGRLVGQSILKNQLKKLNKHPDLLSRDDCDVLIQHITNALSIFVTKQETENATNQLHRLYRTHFA